MFLMSLGFSIILTNVWPYLGKVKLNKYFLIHMSYFISEKSFLTLTANDFDRKYKSFIILMSIECNYNDVASVAIKKFQISRV